MASQINASNSGFGGIVSTGDSSGVLQLQTANTTAVTIDTSQNVGIGTTSPAQKLDVASKVQINTSNSYGKIQIARATDSGLTALYIQGADNAGTANELSLVNAGGGGAAINITGGDLRFYATSNTTERMRIDSSGNVGIGTTSPTYKLDISSGNSNTLNITTNNTNTTIFNITRSSVTTVTHTLDNTGYKIINGGSGGLYLGYTGTSWTSLSDERFKTDLKPIENAAEKVSTLRAVTGRFKTDDEDKSRAFLIAQDIQAVLPEAVDTSNPEQLGVSYTDTIPLLVAAIKEQQTIINDLKARIETLESK